MHKYPGLVSLVLVFAAVFTSSAQVAQSNSSKPDYSQEAAVIEEMSTKVTFDDGGTSTREQTSRVRVQTDAGVKEWGVLSFAFQSAFQTVEIDYVRVRKPDGTTIATPPDNVQDLDSEITRSAPFYSDLREKHVAVKGLSHGDVLEYHAHWVTTKALAPRKFWFPYSFHHAGIVLEERLEVRTPIARAVKFKGPAETQHISTEAGFRVFTWTYSRLKDTKDPGADEQKLTQAALGRLPPPDVQVSSFQSWDEIGTWYWDLQKDRILPSDAIRAKAAELTKGLTDDAAKIRALYTFVSTQYRYIGVAFGIGRYQPHAADDVLSNSYGDCKDKHTLLASLLQAAGITLYPALINTAYQIDPDVPSPAQFDHVIGYLPQAKDSLWLDTTPELAPPGLLMQPLRDKKALVILGGKSTHLLTTPADPPMRSTQLFQIEGKLNDDGSLDARVKDTMRSDNELFLRTAFRRVPQAQWQDLVQQISYTLGYSGTVSDVSASTPEAIADPFQFSYSYHRKDYPDWSNHQFSVPGLPFLMPPVKDDAKYPVWLGPPLESVSEAKVELPKDYTPQVPANVDLKYDFAEYHATYSREKNSLISTRKLLIKMHEVPAAELEDYRTFLKNMQSDLSQYVQTSSGDPRNPSPSAPGATFASDIRNLPESQSPEANRLEATARDQIAKRDLSGALSSLYRAVEADPKFARAWTFLGMLLIAQNQPDAGTDAFHKAMAAEPQSSAIPKALGYTLIGNHKYENAVPVWQDYMKSHPEDVDGPANLGGCLYELHRYSEAVVAYEAALKLRPDRLNLQLFLGEAYMDAGERTKALDTFAKLAAPEVNPQGEYLNEIAYKIANADLQLPTALDYSTRACRALEAKTQKITLPDLKMEDVRSVFSLAAYWDTLGWIYERMSNLDAAESYLLASWKMNQDGVVAGHLCHLYRRQHKITAAIEMCRMAIHRLSMSQNLSLDLQTEEDAARENLDHLTKSAGSSRVPEGADLVIRERTFKMPRFLPGTESAEFFVLFASDGKSKTFKVEDVKFASGSEKMKLQGKQLKTIDFNFPAPPQAPARFVRRGILGCYQYSGCSFVLLDPASVHSLN